MGLFTVGDMVQVDRH